MGYRPEHRIYSIEFEGYPGLLVRSRSISLGKLMSVLSSADDIKGMSTEEAQRHPAFVSFADALVEWNVDHPELEPSDTPPTALELLDGPSEVCPTCGLKPGDPLSASLAGLFCLDLDFVMDMIMGWVTALTRVSQGKAPSLTNGGSAQQETMTRLGALASPLT